MKNWVRVALGTFTVAVLFALVLGEVLSGKMQNAPVTLHAAAAQTPRHEHEPFVDEQPFPLALALSSVQAKQEGELFRGTATAKVSAGAQENDSFQVSFTCPINPVSDGVQELQHARWNVENRELGVLVDTDMGRTAVCNMAVKN